MTRDSRLHGSVWTHRQAGRVFRYGEAITIIFRTKNITVSDQGSALQDGRMGDVINVANEYRQSLRARVIGKGEVLLVN